MIIDKKIFNNTKNLDINLFNPKSNISKTKQEQINTYSINFIKKYMSKLLISHFKRDTTSQNKKHAKYTMYNAPNQNKINQVK